MTPSDLYTKAFLFAFWQHTKAGHEYGLMPYIYHPVSVCNIVADYMPSFWWSCQAADEPFGRSEIVLAAAMCHDLLEDTGLSYKDLSSVIGVEAADIVFAVTDEPGKNRAEKRQKTWPKIAANRLAVFVKMCDRLANRSEDGKADMYDREYPDFRAAFFKQDEYRDLWNALDSAHNFDSSKTVVKAAV